MSNLISIFSGGNSRDPTQIVVRLLARKGQLSAAEICQISGLAKSTVSATLADLRASGIVVPASSAPDSAPLRRVGRPRVRMSLASDAGTIVGVQLLTSRIRVIFADVAHNVLFDASRDSDEAYSPDHTSAVIDDLVAEGCAETSARRSELLGVGVAFPGPVHPSDRIIAQSPVLAKWQGLDVARLIRERVALPVTVANESNCAAIAEMTWGAARGVEDFVFLKIDLGIGGAVVMNGKVREGTNGMAGEFGHISVDPQGALCRCGNRGCFEMQGSLIPVMKHARARFGDELDVNGFVKRVTSGDRGCLRLVEDTAEIIGRTVSIIQSAFDPPLIVIGGRAALLGAPFFDNVKRVAAKSALFAPGSTEIVPGQFAAEDSALGAVGLVLQGI